MRTKESDQAELIFKVVSDPKARILLLQSRSHLATIAPGRYVELSVSDSGVGIDADTRSSIFRAVRHHKSPSCGTGLGLSAVYGIVEQSGGQRFTAFRPEVLTRRVRASLDVTVPAHPGEVPRTTTRPARQRASELG